MNGAPGMPLGAMAQIRPCFFRVFHPSGLTSSTEAQPSDLVTSQSLSSDHFSPALWNHHEATDCLMRPLRFGLSSARAGRAAVAARPARAWRRVNRPLIVGLLREWGYRPRRIPERGWARQGRE